MSWAVRLQDAGKRYLKFEDTPLLLTRAFRFRAAHKRSFLWAVRNVSLEVQGGETVGVIGRNGSGKSTMLRMLAGVTAPSEGSIAVKGRVSPLIAVGVGFHPELTGRENVYVNGMILGLKRREIDRLFDSIVDFAEIESFINTPVKFYSSGMLVRLGFSVAVAATPDVLLVDEVLAVGDMSFQQKCFDRMEQIRLSGTSVLVVSHNLNAIRGMCQQVLVLHDGRPRFSGPTEDGISVYYDLISADLDEDRDAEAEGPRLKRRRKHGDDTAAVEITEMQLFGEDGRPTGNLRHGEEAVLRLRARFNEPVPDASFGIVLTTESGTTAYTDSTFRSGKRDFAAGDDVSCEIRFPMRLVTGSYNIRAGVTWGRDSEIRTSTRVLMFYVAGRGLVKGVVDLGAAFQIRDASEIPTRVADERTENAIEPPSESGEGRSDGPGESAGEVAVP
jgi:ABC-type polysaccharide/polyol phosphate transport system ATPase subunit